MTNSLMPVLVVIIVVAGLVWLVVRYFVRRDEVWQGTVIDKNFSESVRNNAGGFRQTGTTFSVGGVTMGNTAAQLVTRNYYIVVRTTDGKQIRWPVSESLYNTFNLGDELTKDHGTAIPRVVKSAGANQTPSI